MLHRNAIDNDWLLRSLHIFFTNVGDPARTGAAGHPTIVIREVNPV
jgi:hypothetical protein